MTGHTAHSERPERSRNAKAQARHRAKRKAYIEQLETTVTKLQTVLGYTPEDIAALPPPLMRIKELEMENIRLNKECDELRRIVMSGESLPASSNLRRPSYASSGLGTGVERDAKRRKVSGDMDDMYLHSDVSGSSNEVRPPPLTIPQPVPHYSTNNTPGTMFNMHSSAPAFHLPNTPSGSSSTSSPPFSPASMPPSTSSTPAGHRPLSSHQLPQYSQSQANHHYSTSSVKVEDDYNNPNMNSNRWPRASVSQIPPPPLHHSSSYTLPPFNAPSSAGLDGWHPGYSSERAPALHRTS